MVIAGRDVRWGKGNLMKVLVVGAGQGGLHLACSLARHGLDVTLVSSESPEKIASGRVRSTQVMFDPALQHERDERLDFWGQRAPQIHGIGVSIGAPPVAPAHVPRDVPMVDWAARLDGYALSVDQRLKFPRWMEHLERSGGRVVIHPATVSDLQGYADMFDLVVVAAGKGELTEMFHQDLTRSPFTTPQRALSVAYVTGLEPRQDGPSFPAVEYNVLPGLGELIVIPALTVPEDRPTRCDILFFEALPGGPLDQFESGTKLTPQEHLGLMLELMKQFAPWHHARTRGVELTDAGGVLAGRYTPSVSHPVGRLPNGRPVLGMGDVVVRNDPITAQGSNNATHCAQIYARSIVERAQAGGPFDEEWMRATFNRFWDYAGPVTQWTNVMLNPPPHVLDLMGAAGTFPEIAHRFVAGISDPTTLDWFVDEDAAKTYLASQVAAAQAAGG